ncbi:hypothetical protein [Pasteurella sp. PK-2025]|uniref:hypothetical protein n=1 Tax=unclassified Pasteurella TaxID=2621516 RepID=UPI003C710871
MNTLIFNQLAEICKDTGDSKVVNYIFENGMFNFTLELDNDEKINLKFKTSSVFADNISNNKLENTGLLQVFKLSELLTVKDKFYISDSNFKELMNIRKIKANMAIGLLEKEVDYLITYSGYRVIFSFIVNSNDNFYLE